MTSDEIYDFFRSDVVDFERPYLWSDTEVFTYLNDAYQQFVRLIGGIADFTSSVTQVTITAGEPLSTIDPSILRIMSAYRASDGSEITIINSTDIPTMRAGDYGTIRPLFLDTTPGPVRYMLIGAQRNVVRWAQVPQVDDVAQLTIYRLPLAKITGAGQTLDEIGDEHHLHLLTWMKHLAYMKQDAETFDRARSAENGQLFRDYCAQCKAEVDRYKHKTRVVAYGGL